MSICRSLVRFVTTLGGLLSSKVDEGTDALLTTPAGIKAAFKTTRDTWTRADSRAWWEAHAPGRVLLRRQGVPTSDRTTLIAS